MAVLDNCSSVMIFNNLQIFLNGNFSAAATKIRNSSGAHTITKKGNTYGFGESLFDGSVFINIICYYYVVKNPSLYDVNQAHNSDGVECGYDVHIKECDVMLSLRELNNVCIGSLHIGTIQSKVGPIQLVFCYLRIFSRDSLFQSVRAKT